jgi:preprotein translocase subunit SecG
MATFVTIIHVIVCFALIGIVLLQRGKGADMGAAFGGSSQTIFGSSGGATFMSKLTTTAAIVFMLTSIGLGLLYKSSASSIDSSFFTEQPQSAPAEGVPAMPVTPAPPAPAEEKK